MPREYLKKATKTLRSDATDVRAAVRQILDDIEAGGDAKTMEYAGRFDEYKGNITLSRDEIVQAATKVAQKLRDDIRFSHDNVRRFTELQKSAVADVEMEGQARAVDVRLAKWFLGEHFDLTACG